MSTLISNNEIDMLYSRSTSINLAVHRQTSTQEGIDRLGLSMSSSSSESCYSSSSGEFELDSKTSKNDEELVTPDNSNNTENNNNNNNNNKSGSVIHLGKNINNSNSNRNSSNISINKNNNNSSNLSVNNENKKKSSKLLENNLIFQDGNNRDGQAVEQEIGEEVEQQIHHHFHHHLELDDSGGSGNGGGRLSRRLNRNSIGANGKRKSYINGNCSTRSADDNPTTTTTTTTTTNGVVNNLNQPSFNELSITCDTLSETDDEDFKDILMEEDDDDFEQVTEVYVDRDDAIDDDDNNSYIKFESNHYSFLANRNHFNNNSIGGGYNHYNHNNNNNNNHNNSYSNSFSHITRQHRSSSSPNQEFLDSLTPQQHHQLNLLQELYQQSSRRFREAAAATSSLSVSQKSPSPSSTPAIPIESNNNSIHRSSPQSTTGSPFVIAIPSTSHRSPTSFLNSPSHSPKRPISPSSAHSSDYYNNSPDTNTPPIAVPLLSSTSSNTVKSSDQQHQQNNQHLNSNNNTNNSTISSSINSHNQNNTPPQSSHLSNFYNANQSPPSLSHSQSQHQHSQSQYSSSPPATPSTPSSPSFGSVGGGSYSPLSKSSSINKPNMLSTILKKSKKRLTTTFANRDLSDFDETPSYVQIYRGMTGESWRAKVYSTTTVRDLISMLLSTTTIDPSTLTLYISRSLTDSSLGSNSSTSGHTTLDGNKTYERQLHEDEKILKAQRKWSGASVFILKTTKGNGRYSVSSINSETSDHLHQQHQQQQYYNLYHSQHQQYHQQQSVDITPLSSLSSPLIASPLSPSSSVDINIPYMSLNEGAISDMDSTSTNSSTKSPYYYHYHQQCKKESWKIGEYPKEGIRWISPNDLVINTKIGEGSFSRVYKGAYMGKTVAIKVLNDSTPEQWENFKKEYRILSMTTHPRLIRLYGASKESKLLMVMEYCGNGSLIKMMTKKNFNFNWEIVLKWIREAVEGINFLHTMKPALVHRDIKPHNLLITSQYELKVADLGLTKEIDVHTSTLKGTLDYMAPELFEDVAPSPSSDVYSLGIVMWELINRFLIGKYKRPFEDIPQISFSYQIPIFTKQGIRPTMPPNMPPQLEDIITRCWHQDPEKRPTCQQLLLDIEALWF